MKSWREGRPVHRSASDAFAAVIRSKGERMCAAGDAQVVPIKLVRAFLVANPVFFGVPERPRLESDYSESGAREPLKKHAACGADSDDAVIHGFTFGEFPHGCGDCLHRAK